MSQAGKVGDGLARALVTRITEAGLAPGTRLPGEAQMLAEYQVGRGTLREALRILEVSGLIAIRPGPGGGPVVREASTADFARALTLFLQARGLTLGETLQARLVLEPICAAAAARRCTPEDAVGLLALAGSAHAFHASVAELAGNEVVGLFTVALNEICQARVGDLLRPADLIRAHQGIAEAIGAGDAARAELLMRAHLGDLIRLVEQERPGLSGSVIDWMR